MNAGKKILIGFAVLVGIVILFGAIGTASQDKPRPEADICTSGYDALDTDTRFECAKKACKVYRRELAEVEFLNDIQCIGGSLADVVRLWQALYDNFDMDDDLILTIEKREEDGERNENMVKEAKWTWE